MDKSRKQQEKTRIEQNERNKQRKIRRPNYNPWVDSESSEGEIEIQEDSSTFLEMSKNTRGARIPTPYPGMEPEVEPDPDPGLSPVPEDSDDPDDPE